MIQELLYTADSKGGLKGGGSGFSTVLSTEGMASNLAQALERLSGYKHPFDIHDPRSQQITVNYRHAKIKVGGITYHVLSRIADLRHKSTSRSNKLAHHVVLTNSDLPIGGPSHVLAHQGFCRTNWDGQATLVPAIPVSSLPKDDLPARPCENWKVVAGDAGWAGFVAEQLHLKPQNSVNVIFPLGTDTLALTNEVFSLLPPKKRWELTFSTYFTSLPAGTSCSLRFYLDGTSAADNLRRDYRQTIVDLTKPLDTPEESDWVQCARTGKARTPDKPSKTSGRPATESEDEEDPEVLIVEEEGTFRQNQIANPYETTEDLSLLPPSSTRPLSSLRDSFPQGMDAGHTTTEFQRKLRNKRRRKFLVTGTVLAIFAVLLIVGGTFVVSFLKGLGDRQEANNQIASGGDGDSNEARPPPQKNIEVTHPQTESDKTDSIAPEESNTSKSSPIPAAQTDNDGSGAPTGDKSSPKEDTSPTDEVKPIELALYLPHLKSPDKGGDEQPIQVEFPNDWLTEESEVSISQIGLDKLNNQLHGKVSLQGEGHASRKWFLIYVRKNSFGSVEKFRIADLWIEDSAIHFVWKETDKDVLKQLGIPKQRALFNGIRWCLLEVRTLGKPPIILRLSNFEKAKQVRLASEKGGHRLQEFQAKGDENSVLPDFNKAGLIFRPGIVGGDKRFSVSLLSTKKYKSTFALSYKPQSQTKEEYSEIISITVVYKAGATLKESSIVITKELHIPHEIQETIKPLYRQEARSDKPIFKNTFAIGDNQSNAKLQKRLRDAIGKIDSKLGRIDPKLKDLEEQKQKSPKQKQTGRQEMEKSIRELTANKTDLAAAKAWCNAAISALNYLHSASATVSMSVDYSTEEKKYPAVRILSSN